MLRESASMLGAKEQSTMALTSSANSSSCQSPKAPGAEAAGPKKGARQFSKIWGIPRDAVSTSDSDRQVCVLLPHPKLAGVFLVSCLTPIHSLERRQRPHVLTRLKPKQFPLLANPPPHFLSASPPVQLRRQAKHPRNSQSSSRPEPGEASLALIRKRRETLEARGFG